MGQHTLSSQTRDIRGWAKNKTRWISDLHLYIIYIWWDFHWLLYVLGDNKIWRIIHILIIKFVFPCNKVGIKFIVCVSYSNYMLDISPGITTLGGLRWELAGCLLLCWVVVFLCLSKGIKSSGKVWFITTLLFHLIIESLLSKASYIGEEFSSFSGHF